MQLPDRPNVEHLRKQAKARKRETGTTLSVAQHGIARDCGFPSWSRLVRHVQAVGLGHEAPSPDPAVDRVLERYGVW